MVIYVDFLSQERVTKQEYYIMEDIMFDCWHKHRIQQNLRSKQLEANPDSFDLGYKEDIAARYQRIADNAEHLF